jgi:SsrA-binding protein
MKIFVKNRKASHEYEIIEKFDAGLVLKGCEVKSIISGKCSLAEGYITIKNNEAYLLQVNITRYERIDGFMKSIEETRERKLLLTKDEIRKMEKFIREKGLTIIPLTLYYSDTKKIKLELAICRGKKMYDKRETLKKKQQELDMKRETKR